MSTPHHEQDSNSQYLCDNTLILLFSVPNASSRYNHIKQRTTYDRHYNDNCNNVVQQIKDIDRQLGAEALKRYYEKAAPEGIYYTNCFFAYFILLSLGLVSKVQITLITIHSVCFTCAHIMSQFIFLNLLIWIKKKRRKRSLKKGADNSVTHNESLEQEIL